MVKRDFGEETILNELVNGEFFISPAEKELQLIRKGVIIDKIIQKEVF